MALTTAKMRDRIASLSGISPKVVEQVLKVQSDLIATELMAQGQVSFSKLLKITPNWARLKGAGGYEDFIRLSVKPFRPFRKRLNTIRPPGG